MLLNYAKICTIRKFPAIRYIYIYMLYIYINHSKEVYIVNKLPETGVRGSLQ